MPNPVMTSEEFVKKAKEIEALKTVYCWGSFGFPISEYNIGRLAKSYPGFYGPVDQARLRTMIGTTYGFDCVGLIKGIFWGFSNKMQSPNGGCDYCSNGVPDIDCNEMFNRCYDKSSNFEKMSSGEFVWMQGHIGIYVGDGLVIEATPSWKNGVQYSAPFPKSGYPMRKWTSHGKSPYLTYCNQVKMESTGIPVSPTKPKSVSDIAQEVLNGMWGSGEDRRERLEKAGYKYEDIQKEVNEMVYRKKESSEPFNSDKPSIGAIALDIINGKYGNGDTRRNKIEALGYSYEEVQKVVNCILTGKETKKEKIVDINKIALEVIAGRYGSGEERRTKLEQAGYSYDEVQAEVNKLLTIM